MKTVNEINDLLSHPKVRKALIETAGENSIAVIEALNEVSEDEDIADFLSLKVSDVRSVLNKLNEEGFAFYTRKKDENTGWYTYFWTLDSKRFYEWVRNKLLGKYERLRKLVSNGEYYFCPNCGLETVYSFEDAMDINFKCPSCNTTLDLLEENKINRYMPKFKLVSTKPKKRVKKSKSVKKKSNVKKRKTKRLKNKKK